MRRKQEYSSQNDGHEIEVYIESSSKNNQNEKIQINEIDDIRSLHEILGCESVCNFSEPNFNPDIIFEDELNIEKKEKRNRNLVFLVILLTGVVVGVAIGVPWAKKSRQRAQDLAAESKTVTFTNNDKANKPKEEFLPGKNNNLNLASEEKEEKEEEKNIFSTEEEFDVNLPFFSHEKNILPSTYSSCVDLLSHIEEAAKYLSNLVIENTLNEQFITTSSAYYSSSQEGGQSNSNSNYGTNNQVEDIEEADIVKSDGYFVFVAYGNEVLVLSINGTILSRTEMPQISYSFPVVKYWDPVNTIQLYEDGDSSASIPLSYGRSTSEHAGHDHQGHAHFGPTQKIRSLLVDDGRLIVILESFQYTSSLIFLTGAVTAVRLYDVSSEQGTLTLVDTKNIRGMYRTTRSIKGKLHIITSSFITSSIFSSYLNPWMFPNGGNNNITTYKALAYERAKLLIPQFAKQLVAELFGDAHDASVSEYDCNSIIQLSVLHLAQETNSQAEYIPNLTNGNGILNSFVQISSFDMHTSNKLDLSSTISGLFLPTNYLDVYAIHDKIFLASRGWKKAEKEKEVSWDEHTIIFEFDLSISNSNLSSTPTLVATGNVPGVIYSSYSIDYYNGYLRVASSSTTKWKLDAQGKWQMQDQGLVSQISILHLQESALEIIGQINRFSVDERIFAVRFLQERAFIVSFKKDDPFYVFDLSNPTHPIQVSELDIPGYSNYLHPITISNDDDVEEESTDLILAVGQNVNYTSGKLLGLQITLFNMTSATTYSKNINDAVVSSPKQIQKFVLKSNDSLIGTSSAAQYDTLSFRYIESNNLLILPVSIYSITASPITNLTENNYLDGFDGFFLFGVDAKRGIKHLGQIAHYEGRGTNEANKTSSSERNYTKQFGSSDNTQCYSWAYLPARSFLFDKNKIMTMKGHNIILTESKTQSTLESEKATNKVLWKIDLDQDRKRNSQSCMPWFS